MRTRQKYVNLSAETIDRARQIDLLTYLLTYEPDNLVRVTSNVYCTREHDSLKISNGKWYWWSRGFGGVSALDYLIKVKDFHFAEAVQLLTGDGSIRASPPNIAKETAPKPLYLPKKNSTCSRVLWYLIGRGIDETIIRNCIEAGIIYESLPYHNVVFVGKDEKGEPRFATCRSTAGSNFKRDASGSDKRFSFRLVADQSCTSLHLFEAAIDLLSYATYLKHKNRDYRKENLLSLAGVYQPKKDIKSSKVPVALTEFLKKNPQIKTIFLHLDNDKAGRLSTKALTELLKNEYEIVDAPPPIGKDVNDFLVFYRSRYAKRLAERAVRSTDIYSER